MRILVIIGTTVALAACNTTAQDAQGLAPGAVLYSPYKLSAAQVAAVQRGVTGSLRDPESARFGAIAATVSTKDGTITVCGLVNAKNGFGGYSGNKQFNGLLAKDIGVFMPVGLAGTESESYAIAQTCSARGLTFS